MVKKIGHLGPAGTFTEEAAILYDARADRIPLPSVGAVASAVEAGSVDEGVVAIENSIEGSVTDTLDLLIHDSNLFIKHELVLPVTQCLIVKPGTSLDQVQAVYSHPQALGQSRAFLLRKLPNAHAVAALSTVAAVEDMNNADTPSAAIGPRRAAALHDSHVLIEGIQDHKANATRFVVLATEDHPPTGGDKTSIAFTFSDEDKPGQLSRALGDFASIGVNLTKVESRPSKESLGKYIFLVDFEGHRSDEQVAQALDRIRKWSTMLKVFGSYPRYVIDSQT